MRYLSALVAVLTLVFVSASFVTAQDAKPEMVENPNYGMWAKFGTGSNVSHKMNMTAMGQNMETTVKSTLVEVAADKVVIEITATMTMGGQAMPPQTQKQEVMKMISKAQADEQGVDMEAIAKATEETVTVAAGTFKCKVISIEREQDGMKMKVKTWISDEIPGGQVKLEGTGEGAMTMTMNLECTAVEKK